MGTFSLVNPDCPLPIAPLKCTSILSTPQTNPRSFYGFSRHRLTTKLEFCVQRRSFPFRSLQNIQRNVIVMSQTATAGSPLSVHLGSRVRGICFYAVTTLTAIPLFLVMMLVHPFVMIFDRYKRRVHHMIAKIWATLAVFPFYRLQFEGLDNLPPGDAPAVYVSNHQSFLDTYTLLTLGRSFKFISKTSIFVIPFIGWAMFLMGLIPLRRMDNRSQLGAWVANTFILANINLPYSLQFNQIRFHVMLAARQPNMLIRKCGSKRGRRLLAFFVFPRQPTYRNVLNAAWNASGKEHLYFSFLRALGVRMVN